MNIKKIVEESRASIEKEDLRIFLQLTLLIKPKYILEIGTWKGYSAETWISAFEPQKFVTIEKESKFPDALEIENINYKYFWNTDSHNNDIQFNTEPYDFLFIDGDHSFEGVTKDWEMYRPLVHKGGIVVFHDACYHADKTEEVDILWNQLKNKYPYVEIKSGEKSTGMGIIYI